MTVEKHTLLFWAFAIGHLAIWTFAPSFVQPNYRLDVVEMIFCGKEWVLQTNKHPMFPAWMNEILWTLTNGAHFTPFLAAQLCVLVCQYSVWRVARDLLPKTEALLAVFIMGAGYWYYNYESTQFNANTTLMAASAAATALLYFALKTNRLFYWVGTGVAIACGFYSKYTMIFWVISALIYLCVNKDSRKCWRGVGPYVTTLIAFSLFLPHLHWLVGNEFITLKYAQECVERPNFSIHFFGPLAFIVEQFGYIAPIVILSLPMLNFRKLSRIQESTFFAALILLPFLMHVFLSGIFALDIVKNYGAQIWPFLSILLFISFERKMDAKSVKRTLVFCVIAWTIMLSALVIRSYLTPYFKGKPLNVHFPATELANRADAIWHERFDTPCKYYTGNWWLAGNAANNSIDRPTVHFYYLGLENGQTPSANWSNDEDVNKSGGVVFWNWSDDIPDYVKKRFPAAEILEPLTLPYQTGAKIQPLRVGIAIVPPI